MNYWLVAASLFWICNLNHAYGSDGLGRSPLVTILGTLPVIAVAIFIAILLIVRWVKKLMEASKNRPPMKSLKSIKKNKSN